MNTFLTQLCFIGALCLLTGCVHQLQFQVIDASNGNRLSGVTVKSREVTSFSYLHRTLKERDMGSTDMNGMITVAKVSSDEVIHFNASGYRGAAAGLSGKKTIRINWSLSPPTESWTPSRQIITNCDGSIVIPMQPVSSKKH